MVCFKSFKIIINDGCNFSFRIPNVNNINVSDICTNGSRKKNKIIFNYTYSHFSR